VLLQAPPFAQKNEEGIPTNQVEQQGAKTNNKTTKQQWGREGG